MITVSQFPQQQCSLAALVPTFQQGKFELTIKWHYTPGGTLQIDLDVKGEHGDSLNRLVCDYLGSHNALYEIINSSALDTRICDGQQQFVLIPNKNMPETQGGALNEASLQVLLAGLKAYNAAFVVRLSGDVTNVRGAASIICPQGVIPKEVPFAFPRFLMTNGAIMTSWFNYDNSKHSDLLALATSTTALVTGYGEDRQAVLKPTESDNIIGTILNDYLGQKLTVTEENWRSSTTVFGSPGYGKTTLMRSLLYQAWRKQNVSFLVIDPKQDYRSLKTLIPEMRVIAGLKNINPLVPPRGCDPYQYAEVLINLLSLSTPIPEDSPLPGYIRQVYYMALKDKNLSMNHFLELYKKYMSAQSFVGQAINFIISGKNRLEDLFRVFWGPDFKDTEKMASIGISELLQQPCVIELGQVPTSQAIGLFMYYITAHVKMFIQRRQLDHVTNCLVLEEAHAVLAPIINEKVRYEIANLLAEGRGRGLSCIVIDQSPSRLDQQATNICGNAISFRLVSPADRDYAAAQLGIEGERLNALRKRTCIVRTNSMYHPETVHVTVDPQLL